VREEQVELLLHPGQPVPVGRAEVRLGCSSPTGQQGDDAGNHGEVGELQNRK
jgi:hypothetical protein